MANQVAPRIKHNLDLCDKLIAGMSIPGRFPRVTMQADTFAIEPGRLVRHGYNPSIVEDYPYLLMAYRFHDGNTLSTRLALAKISMDDGKVLENRPIEATPDVSMEDPKLFWWRDQIHILWVESTWPQTPLRSVVKWAPLKDGKVGAVETATHRNPRALEKNWVPFPDCEDYLHLIYSCYPQQEICAAIDGKLESVHVAPGFHWPWGEPRGGTVPIALGDDRLLRFFHAGSDNEYGPWRRRYFMGAMTMRDRPPFEPIAWSKEPILYGSEDDDVPVDQWSKCFHRKGQVVFPGGAVRDRYRRWLVAVGINDYSCAIVKLTDDQLNL